MKMLYKKESLYSIMLILIIFYANFITKPFKFDLYYSLYGDAALSYFLHAIKDNSLFKNDIFVSIFNNPIYLREYCAFLLYKPLLLIFPLFIVLKLIAIAICVLATFIIYKIGKETYISNDFPIMFACLFLIYSLSTNSFFGGIGRCFGMLIVCLIVYVYVKKSFIFLPFLLPFTAVYYLPILPLVVTTCFLTILYFKTDLVNQGRFKLYILILIISIAIAYVLCSDSYMVINILKNQFSFQQNKFTQNVTLPINVYNPWHIFKYFILNLNEHSELYVYFTYFLLVANAILIMFRKKDAFRLPIYLWIILFNSFICFVILYPLNPTFASRQLVFTVPVFLVSFFTININKYPTKRIFSFILLVCATSIFLVLHPIYNNIDDYSVYKKVYNYVLKLENNTILAGFPDSDLIITIPFFGKRQIFHSRKLLDANKIFYSHNENKERLEGLIKALYTRSFKELRDFIIKYNINYFVIETKFYNLDAFETMRPLPFSSNKIIYSSLRKASNIKDPLILRIARKFSSFIYEQGGNQIYILDTSQVNEKNLNQSN